MKVSIIIAVYNGELYIEEAINSILRQTECDFELIIVNDGSIDKTLEIINIIARTDKRIIIISQENSGSPAIPRNKGISVAKGEYICFLDADDLYAPEKIKKQLELLEKYQTINLVFHEVGLIDCHGKSLYNDYLQSVEFITKSEKFILKREGNIYFYNKYFYCFISTQITALLMNSVMVRRELLLKQSIWFEEEFRIGEDIDLWFRLVKNKEIIFINEVLSYYRQHESSITNNDEHLLRGSIMAHSRNYERGKDVFSDNEKKIYAKRIGMNYMNLAYILYKQNQMKAARENLIKANKITQEVSIFFPFLKTYIPVSIFGFYRNLTFIFNKYVSK